MSSTVNPTSTPGGATHEVINQPPPFEDYNAFDADPALGEALEREGGGWVKAPTLVIAGSRDPATPPEHAELISKRISDTRLTVLDCAHLSNVECAPEFTAAVLGFLSGSEPLPA